MCLGNRPSRDPRKLIRAARFYIFFCLRCNSPGSKTTPIDEDNCGTDGSNINQIKYGISLGSNQQIESTNNIYIELNYCIFSWFFWEISSDQAPWKDDPDHGQNMLDFPTGGHSYRTFMFIHFNFKQCNFIPNNSISFQIIIFHSKQLCFINTF
jgi:hypothetical protein